MSSAALTVSAATGTGESMHAFMRELFPICRSITGAGVRETLTAVGRRIPLELREVPTGAAVLDWIVPDEWNIRDAYIAKDGHRVVDFRESNLHVVSYSEPVRAVMPLADLRPHLHTLPEHAESLSYRLLFIPGTIGSITWLARNDGQLSKIVAGLVLACVGDSAPLTYKRSRRGGAIIDRAAAYVLGRRDTEDQVVDFIPWGWDERQFNSPGFDLPVGSLNRSREGEYEEYHSSADNLELISPRSLEEAFETVCEIIEVLESDRSYVNLAPKGEPQLGKRGLYPQVGGPAAEREQLALLWVLNQSDGQKSLLDIAERSGLWISDLRVAAELLLAGGLLFLL